jgi:hypothetical protein
VDNDRSEPVADDEIIPAARSDPFDQFPAVDAESGTFPGRLLDLLAGERPAVGFGLLNG